MSLLRFELRTSALSEQRSNQAELQAHKVSLIILTNVGYLKVFKP